MLNYFDVAAAARSYVIWIWIRAIKIRKPGTAAYAVIPSRLKKFNLTVWQRYVYYSIKSLSKNCKPRQVPSNSTIGARCDRYQKIRRKRSIKLISAHTLQRYYQNSLWQIPGHPRYWARSGRSRKTQARYIELNTLKYQKVKINFFQYVNRSSKSIEIIIETYRIINEIEKRVIKLNAKLNQNQEDN